MSLLHVIEMMLILLTLIENTSHSRSMATWTSLPYELKLHIAKDLIDVLILHADAIYTPSNIDTAIKAWRKIRTEHVPAGKLQIGAVLEMSPVELGRDLSCYCRQRYGLDVPNDQLSRTERIDGRARRMVARSFMEYLEQHLSS